MNLKLLLLLCLISINPIIAHSSEQDAKIMLDMLLSIKNDKYNTTTNEGKAIYDSLLEYKTWSRVYIKYAKPFKKNKRLTKQEMKYLLFIGFVARAILDASTSESLATDIIPIYNQNKALLLKSLASRNFLIPSTCYYMNRYFGFEDKNEEKKIPFIKQNKELIIMSLGKVKGDQCMSYFK